MHSNKLTFYVLCFGIITYLIRLKFGLEFKGTFNVLALINIVGIVIFSTILSLEFTTLAVRHVGATPTAIIGALEPASGIFWGIVVFHEVLTPRMILGIVMIL